MQCRPPGLQRYGKISACCLVNTGFGNPKKEWVGASSLCRVIELRTRDWQRPDKPPFYFATNTFYWLWIQFPTPLYSKTCPRAKYRISITSAHCMVHYKCWLLLPCVLLILRLKRPYAACVLWLATFRNFLKSSMRFVIGEVLINKINQA